MYQVRMIHHKTIAVALSFLMNCTCNVRHKQAGGFIAIIAHAFDTNMLFL